MAETKGSEESKKSAALMAVDEIEPGMKVGLGTGSTSKYFIEELAKRKLDVTCVPSSVATEQQAKKLGLKVVSLDQCFILDAYVDGADEVDAKKNLIKGGGGALTREKIVASAANEFICIVDESKLVKKLGAFPLPIEVIPFAKNYFMNEMRDLGATMINLRQGFITDNGNIIIDVQGLDFRDPLELEDMLNNTPGVVENGIFAMRQPERVIVGKGRKAEEMK